MKRKTTKLRPDSNWSGLTPEQQELLEQWLFRENLTYEKLQARVLEKWGMVTSVSSVGRYYRWRVARRTVGELGEVKESSDAIEATEAKTEELRRSAMKVIGKRFLENAMESGDTKDLATLGRIILQSEEREIQKGRLALAQERFEFNAAKAALAELPNLKQMSQEDAAREEERVRAIKWRLFGNRVLRERKET